MVIAHSLVAALFVCGLDDDFNETKAVLRLALVAKGACEDKTAADAKAAVGNAL